VIGFARRLATLMADYVERYYLPASGGLTVR
jgi:hypothetical protein